MASTFNENKKIKCDQYPCQSWYKHVGIDRSNNLIVDCSARFFRERRNRKTSSKSDEASDLPSTSQVNGHDSDLEEDESSDDPDHNHYLYPSDLTELWLVNCDICDNFCYPDAFCWHNEIRHSQPQDPEAIQYSFYQKKPKPIPKPKPEKKKKVKNETKNTTDVQNKNSEKTDTSKNNDSEANVVDNLDVKSGPGHGKKKRKRKRITYGPKKRRKQVPVDNENFEETTFRNVTESVIEVPLVNGNIGESSLENVTKSIIEVLENVMESSLEIVTAFSIEELEDEQKAIRQPQKTVNCQLKRTANCQLKRTANCQLKRTANCQLKRGANCQLKRAANCQLKRAVNYQLKQIVNCQFERTVNCQLKGAVNCRLKGAVNCQLKRVISCQLKEAVNSQLKGAINCQLKDILNYYLKRIKNYQLKGALIDQLKRALTCYLKRVMSSQLKGILTCYLKRVMRRQFNRSLNGYLKRAQNGMRKHPMIAKAFASQAVRKGSVQFNVSSQHRSLLREKLVINQSTNFMKMLSVPPLVNNVINYKTKDYYNFERKLQNTFYKTKLASLSITKSNVFCYNNHSLVYNCSPAYSSPFKLGSIVNGVIGRNNLKNHLDYTPTNNFLKNIINANLNFEKLYNGMLPKRFNGFYKKKSAQKNSTVIPLENKKKDSSFHIENTDYLSSYVDGSELSYRSISKTKPGVKLKRQKIRKKLKAALESPIYKQCLQTIKLNPIKIQKALNSVDILSKVEAKKQFRTFSDLNYILPSDKSFKQTKVSCSVNTSAKSASINSWNNVPFRYQSRKCFFPSSGNQLAESGLVLSNCAYEKLRATFNNQNELDTSSVHSEESDFINIVSPNSQKESTSETEKLDHKEIMLEKDLYEGQQNASPSSSCVNSPTESEESESDLYEEQENGSPASSYLNSPSEYEELENDLCEEQQNGSPSSSYLNSPSEYEELENDLCEEQQIESLSSPNVNSASEYEEFENDLCEEQQNESLSSPNVNTASNSDLVSVKINSSQSYSNYLNEYNQDADQLQEMSTMECTPISRPSSPEPVCEKDEIDDQETELLKKTSSSNMPRDGMRLIMPEENFWIEYGLNGNNYRDYNREQNQGSKDR
ncbi:Titin like protein [Argiope bruennichi]|uniref:Titin like protein n=1 Tax=Argiope bruennichi TaxID=94029 RepID=A0A8T0E978_ARGBR|nr:Titin like protein [Argiope bruennichi]